MLPYEQVARLALLLKNQPYHEHEHEHEHDDIGEVARDGAYLYLYAHLLADLGSLERSVGLAPAQNADGVRYEEHVKKILAKYEVTEFKFDGAGVWVVFADGAGRRI